MAARAGKHQVEMGIWGLLAENLSDGLIVTDLHERIIYANLAVTRMTGYTGDELLGQHPVLLIAEEQADTVQRAISECLGRGERWRGEILQRRKDGDTYLARFEVFPVRDREGRVIAWASIQRDITEQKRIEERLRHRVQFENLVSTISARFVNLSPGQLDAEIDSALEAIGELTGVDRSYVFLFRENGRKADNTHEWCAPGIDPQIANLQDFDTDSAPWWMDKFRRFEIVHIPRVADLPPEASQQERYFLEAQDIQSLIAVPLILEKSVVGFLGLDAVRAPRIWLEEEITLLKMIGSVFANALDRQNSRAALQAERQRLFSLLDELPAFVYLQRDDYTVQFANRYLREIFGEPEGQLCYAVFEGRESPCRKCHAHTVFDLGSHTEWEWTAPGGRVYQVHDYPFTDVDGTNLALVMGIDITERKKAEVALRESEERYRQLVELSPDAIVLHSEGKVVFANAATVRLSRAGSLDNLIGRQALDFVHPDSREAVASRIKTALETGQPLPIMQHRYLRCDGSVADVEVTAAPMTVAGQPAILAIIRDITELNRAKGCFEKAFYASPYGMAIQRISDRCFINVNDRFTEVTGYQRHEVVGRTLPYDLILWDGTDRENIISTIRTQGILNREVRVRTKSGDIRTGLLSAQMLVIDDEECVLAALNDITERKRAEEALRESEECYRCLVEHLQDAVLLVDTAGRFVEANPAACRMLGYSREELLTIGVKEMIAPESVEKAIQFSTGLRMQDYVSDEIECKTRVGDSLFVKMAAKTLPDGNTLLTARDITERKKAEEMKRELARFDRLDLLGQMAAGIAHEIRNPMTVARGFIQMLGENPECQSHRAHLQLIIDELDRASGIISEYLALARVKPPLMVEQNLNIIIETMLPLIKADAASRNIEIVTGLGTIPVLLCDEREIRQLILNLVRNGVEATVGGGMVTITTSVQDTDVLLAVQDQGPGIPPDVLEKLGTPFFSTKERGTGLGLATCYSIAGRHNASVEVKTGGNGTTFCVRFRC